MGRDGLKEVSGKKCGQIQGLHAQENCIVESEEDQSGLRSGCAERGDFLSSPFRRVTLPLR